MRERGQGRRKTLSSRARARGAAIDGALRCHAGKNITVVARSMEEPKCLRLKADREREHGQCTCAEREREREMHDHFCTLLDLPLSISVRM